MERKKEKERYHQGFSIKKIVKKMEEENVQNEKSIEGKIKESVEQKVVNHESENGETAALDDQVQTKIRKAANNKDCKGKKKEADIKYETEMATKEGE